VVHHSHLSRKHVGGYVFGKAATHPQQTTTSATPTAAGRGRRRRGKGLETRQHLEPHGPGTMVCFSFIFPFFNCTNMYIDYVYAYIYRDHRSTQWRLRGSRSLETRQARVSFSLLLFFFITALTFAYYKFHWHVRPLTWHSTTSNGARDMSRAPFSSSLMPLANEMDVTNVQVERWSQASVGGLSIDVQTR
jgi:hypothetical protein